MITRAKVRCMDLPSDTAESEELSFEKDPARGPRAIGQSQNLGSRRRNPTLWKPTAAAVAVGMIVAGVVADGPRRDLPLLSPPDGPWPVTGTFVVYLCEDNIADVWPACEGAATAQEMKDIEETLASISEITTYRRQTPE